nr:putative ribonuclease H-like domain-containing protein [Tanacetum cinerariifolium]
MVISKLKVQRLLSKHSTDCRPLKNTYSLNTKISKLNEELSDSENTLYHYKLGLSQVEARLVEFKTQEIKFCEKIRGLEFNVEVKNNKIENLMNELEQVKKEKEGLDSKPTEFQSTLKDLDTLLGSHSADKNKEGLGYSVVPPSCSKADSPTVIKTNKVETARKSSVKYAEMYRNASKSHKVRDNQRLPEFVDDTVTDYRRPTPSIDASKCNKSEIQSSNFSVFEHGESTGSIMSKPMIKFVKEANCPGVIKINNIKNARKSTVKYAEMYRNISKCPKGNPQNNIDDKGYWDSGWSRHMTGNISYLSEYEPYDGGYVSFGHGGGKLTGKGIIKTSKLEFENIYFVKELKYNLFSMSQICDNKNSVLFTDSECLVLGKDFKLNDDTNGNPHNNIDDKGYWDSGCSRHMTENISYLSEYESYDGGYVSFGHEGGKITGIRREFSNARTPQQNEVAKRRNRSLIEAARTMLVDAKLPVTFWAEAVNIACYVQNRVLVNKSQNRIPYELFNSRIPGIRFLRPFGYYVMILNTLDHLGKFDVKGDEGYFVRYSLSSKAFRVFNKRTKKVEENLHVDFLKNKLIEKGSGPNWLFDINTLTNSMNYVPVVVAGTSSTNILGTKDVAIQAMKKDVSSLRYIALLNWFHEAHMETSNDTIRNSDAQDDSQKEQDCNADVPESCRISNPTATLKVPSVDQVEPVVSLTVESEILIVSSPVPTVCLDISPESSNGSRLISKGIFSQKEAPSLGNALTLSNRFEDTFGDTTNTVTSNEVEADLSNMKTSIPVSPTPTFRIHKDHPKSHIIGPVDTPVQTRHKSKDMEEQRVRPTGTKWVLKNKKDKRGIVIRNKARLVAQRYNQEEGINYEEVFTPVARIEAIRLFLACALFMGFIVYQMDVKSAFLYGTIDEELYVMQPPRFQDPEFPERVYKVEKAMHGPHQAPRAWEFEALMHDKLQMSALGKLTFFLGLQVIPSWDYGTLESPFDLVAYLDNDYGGATQDRKSTTRGCQFLGRRLISWQCKKQTIVATSTTETEYVAAASGYGQVIWIQN